MVIRVENARENDCSLFCLVDSKADFKYEIYNKYLYIRVTDIVLKAELKGTIMLLREAVSGLRGLPW